MAVLRLTIALERALLNASATIKHCSAARNVARAPH
jgi:hypothetical protein